jgi:hypothetical protein
MSADAAAVTPPATAAAPTATAAAPTAIAPTVTTTSTATSTATRRWTDLLRRWPTWLALGMTAATMGGGDLHEIIEGYGEALLLLPLLYLVVAKLERRGASWLVLAAGFAAIIVLRLVDVVAPSVVFVVVALAALVWSAVGEKVGEPGMLRVEALGMIGFGALAVAGLAVDVEVGRYLVAAGWFLHGVWDFVHLRLDKVVSRSYAEWCGVIDILVGIQLAFLV